MPRRPINLAVPAIKDQNQVRVSKVRAEARGKGNPLTGRILRQTVNPAAKTRRLPAQTAGRMVLKPGNTGTDAISCATLRDNSEEQHAAGGRLLAERAAVLV